MLCRCYRNSRRGRNACARAQHAQLLGFAAKIVDAGCLSLVLPLLFKILNCYNVGKNVAVCFHLLSSF